MDPYAVLGVTREDDKATIKRAYRQKALLTHPDLNTSPCAAEEYERVYKAAQAILNGGSDESAATGSRRAQQGLKGAFDRFTRRSSFPLYFSAACLIGGCFIFAGAVHAHKAIFDGYSYNVLQEVEKRRESPSPVQLRINALLVEKRAEASVKKGEQ